MKVNMIKLFLRLAIGIGFLSAVADRLGYWNADVSAWGDWKSFVSSTKIMNPWFPEAIIPTLAIIVTVAEITFGLLLIVGYKTTLTAKLSGVLLLIFAISMTLTGSVKAPLDYGVFGLAAAAFALSTFNNKFLEIESLCKK